MSLAWLINWQLDNSRVTYGMELTLSKCFHKICISPPYTKMSATYYLNQWCSGMVQPVVTGAKPEQMVWRYIRNQLSKPWENKSISSISSCLLDSVHAFGFQHWLALAVECDLRFVSRNKTFFPKLFFVMVFYQINRNPKEDSTIMNNAGALGHSWFYRIFSNLFIHFVSCHIYN